MALVLNGSGTIQSDDITLSGNANVTGAFAVTGNMGIATADLPTGSVLQVVNATNTAEITTTSTSYVTTGISASITPSSTSSKIIVSCVPNGVYSTQIAIWFTLYKNGVDISGSLNELVQLYSSSGNVLTSLPFIYYDSPNSTSTQTYTLYWKVSSGTGTLNYQGVSGETTIMLQEVAG